MLNFDLQTETEGRSALVRIRGDLDLQVVDQVTEALSDIESEGPELLVIDLSGLSFMDSSGVRVLVAAHAKAADGGGELTIVRPERGGAVDRILEVSGIEQALQLVDEPSR